MTVTDFLILTLIGMVQGTVKTRLAPKIHGVWECPPSLNAFTTLYNYSIGLDRNGMDTLTIYGRLDRDVIRVPKVRIKADRCVGGVSTDSCESFLTWTFDKGCCQLISAKGAVWTPFVDSVTPLFKCPASKGNYTVINATADYNQINSILSGMSLDSWIWKVRLEVWNEKRELVVCAKAIAELRRMKMRS